MSGEKRWMDKGKKYTLRGKTEEIKTSEESYVCTLTFFSGFGLGF